MPRMAQHTKNQITWTKKQKYPCIYSVITVKYTHTPLSLTTWPKKMPLTNTICQDGYHVIDNFLDPHHYHSLCKTIQNLHDNGQCKPAKIGKNQKQNLNTTIRNDQIVWIDKQGGNDAIAAYFKKIDALCETLNQSLFLGLIDYEAHFAVYQPNGFYKKHIDQFATTQDRRISCVYYLNKDWQQDFGGELMLYDTKDQPLSRIKPIGNRFVCFNSDLPHEVCTAYQTRYSIAAWLKVRPMGYVSY